MSEIDRILCGMCLSITGAIPIKIGSAFTPCHALILSYDGDSDLLVADKALFKGTKDRQLPTSIRLSLVELTPFAQREKMECTTHPPAKSFAIKEDARVLDFTSLAVTIKANLADGEFAAHLGDFMELPDIWSKSSGRFLHSLLIILARVVSTIATTSGIRFIGFYPLTSTSIDAIPG